MKKLLFISLLILLVSCKTKTILTENVRNTKDSTENVQLKGTISEMEKVLQSALFQAKTSEQKMFEAIEKLSISEIEKQHLKESFETSIKEYNENGVLVKETYSKRTSELQKDLSRSEQRNKELTETVYFQADIISKLQKESEYTSNQVVELTKITQLLEKENKELKSKNKSSTKINIWLLAAGFLIGLIAYFYLNKLIQKIKIQIF